MQPYINHQGCPYIKFMDNNDRFTLSQLGPLFMNVLPRRTRFQKSLCGYGFRHWNNLPVDLRKIAHKDAFADDLKRRLYLEQNLETEEYGTLPTHMRRT